MAAGAKDPARLWEAYVQLSEAEAAFWALKSEVKVRPIWHWLERRVEAHVLAAFLGYCLWVCLKHRLRSAAPSLTPWQALDQLGRISLSRRGGTGSFCNTCCNVSVTLSAANGARPVSR